MSARPKKQQQDFVFDIWYFAGLASDIRKGQMIRREIAGEPLCLGRQEGGSLFALRDICPHRAAPFSKGCLKAVSYTHLTLPTTPYV